MKKYKKLLALLMATFLTQTQLLSAESIPGQPKETTMKVQGKTNFKLVSPDDGEDLTYGGGGNKGDGNNGRVDGGDNSGNNNTGDGIYKEDKDPSLEFPLVPEFPGDKDGNLDNNNKNDKDNSNSNNNQDKNNNNNNDKNNNQDKNNNDQDKNNNKDKNNQDKNDQNKDNENDTDFSDVDIDDYLKQDSDFNPDGDWTLEQIEEYIRQVKRRIAKIIDVIVPLTSNFAVYGEGNSVVSPNINVVNNGTALVDFELVGVRIFNKEKDYNKEVLNLRTENGTRWTEDSPIINTISNINWERTPVGKVRRGTVTDMKIDGEFQTVTENTEMRVGVVIKATPIVPN